MNRFLNSFKVFAVMGVLLIAITQLSAAVARDLVPAEQRESAYTGQVPRCDDAAVLDRLSARFSSRENEYWKSDLAISGVDKIHQVAFRPHGADYIPRRFCAATGTFSDGKKRMINYVIGEDLGITGYGFLSSSWGVTWCVQGLDRNMAYAPECRMARP